jgi:outer membrane protein TolC
MVGNSSDLPEDINYPLTEEPDPENLISEKTEYHPAFILPQMEYLISKEEIRLSKSESLPEFQIGYSSEIVPGETYAGPVGGMTIPLWSNANKVKTASAMADHMAAMRDAELTRLRSEVLSEYYNMKALIKSINELKDILATGDNERYLNSALNNGEISLTTYFSDLEIIYQVEDRLYELEYEYNKSLATLLDHKLIE